MHTILSNIIAATWTIVCVRRPQLRLRLHSKYCPLVRVLPMRTHTTPRATIAQTRSNSYISTWFIMSSFATSQLSAIFWEKSQNYTIASFLDLHAQEVWFPRCTQRIISMDVFLIGHTTRNLISGLCPWGIFLIGHLLEIWLVGFARGGPNGANRKYQQRKLDADILGVVLGGSNIDWDVSKSVK